MYFGLRSTVKEFFWPKINFKIFWFSDLENFQKFFKKIVKFFSIFFQIFQLFTHFLQIFLTFTDY